MISWWFALASAAELDVRVGEQEDGDAVAGARVEVGDETWTTDARGRVRVDVDGAGPWSLVVAAEGRQTTTVEVSDAVRPVRVFLAKGLGNYEIVVEGLKLTADPSRHVVDGEQALETPGTLDDAIRLVQSLPGMTVQREYSPTSGDLAVRGAQPGESRYYLDGIEIPYLYHFNQYASVFPASQVADLELFPSTFSARYGDAVGGIVEARSRLDVPDGVSGSAHMNFVMFGGDVRVPLSRPSPGEEGEEGDLSRRWWLSAAGRRSYQDLAGEQTAQFTVWPTFYDVVARVERGNADNGLGFFAVAAGDGYTRAVGELDVLDPLESTTTPSLAYREGYQLAGVRRQWDRGNTRGRLVGALVHHQRRGELSSTGRERLEAWTVSSRTDVQVRPAQGPWAFDLGYEVNAERTALLVESGGRDGVRVAEEAPALARGVDVDDALLRARAGLYGTAHWTLGRARLMPGLRLSADTTRAEARADPRFALRWQAHDNAMFKIGGGRYTQRARTEYLIGQTDPLPTTESWQVSAGWEQAIAGRLEVGVEGYFKALRNPLRFPIDGPAEVVPRGDAMGVEVLTRYRLREVFFLWGWVALQRTRLIDEAGAISPTNGDQRWSGGVVASWDIGRWNLGARYRFAQGLPFTPIDGAVYDGSRDGWDPIPGPVNSARLPAYQKLDLRVAHRWDLKGWSLQAVLELWYVPPASTQLYPIWNFDFTEQDWVLGPGILPLVGVRAKF